MKNSVLQIWAKKEPKINLLIEIDKGSPDVFRGVKGLEMRTVKSVKKKGVTFRRGMESLAEKEEQKEQKFSRDILPKVDAIDDSFRMAKAFLKSEHPDLYKRYFRR